MTSKEMTLEEYMNYLKNLTHIKYVKPSKMILNSNGVLVAAEPPQVKKLPPNNCIFNITDIHKISEEERMKHRNFVFSAASRGKRLIPHKFDWKKKNENITPVPNQYLCGCCWAVATATCIADKFIVAKLTPENPKISWSYIISCWINEINNQCQGSNPFLALKYIQYYGIGTDNELNYSWCKLNSSCNPKIDINTPENNSESELNYLVPKCTSTNPKNNFFVHKIKGVPLTLENFTNEKLEASILIVKHHIIKHGPVIGGFLVYSNFKTGDFICNGKNPSNIYLENVDYDSCTYQTLDLTTNIGSHAVVITGWGTGYVQQSLLESNSTSTEMIPVNYWIVRNSWGKEWGSLGGYFHIAQYPINKYSQFDISNIINTPVEDPKTKIVSNKNIIISGIIMFEPLKNAKNLNTIESYTSNPISNLLIINYFIISMIILTIIIFIIVLICKK